MAVNRFDGFTNLDLSYKMYNPIEWQPNAALWANVFGNLQKQLNEVRDFQAPKHISKSADAVKQKMDQISSTRDSIVEGYKSGDFRTARQMQNDLVADIVKSKQPGGWFYEEEQMYTNYQKIIDDQKETLEDSPAFWKNAAKRSINLEGSSIDDDGNYVVGSVNAPEWSEYMDIPKEVLDMLDGYEADQGVFIKRMGDKFVYAGSKKTVSPEEIRTIATSIMNSPKYKEQIAIEAKMLGYNEQTITTDTELKINRLRENLTTEDGVLAVKQQLMRQGLYRGELNSTIDPELNEAIVKYQEELNSRDPFETAYNQVMGNYLIPVVGKLGYEQESITHLRGVGSGSGSGESSFQNGLTNVEYAIETEVFTNGGMTDWRSANSEFSSSDTRRNAYQRISQGEFIPEENTQSIYDRTMSFYYDPDQTPSGARTSDLFDTRSEIRAPTYLRWLQTEAKDSSPIIYDIYSNLKEYIDNMPVEKVEGFVKEMYNKKREALSTTTNKIYSYNSSKERDEANKVWLGKAKGSGASFVEPGKIKDSNIYLFEPGKAPRLVTYTELISELGTTTGGFTANSSLSGRIASDNPAVISGLTGDYVTPQGKKYHFVIEDQAGTFDPRNAALHTYSQPSFKGGVEKSDMIVPSVAALQYFVGDDNNKRLGRLYTMGRDVWLSEHLQDQISDLETKGSLTPREKEELSNLKSELTRIENRPELNEYHKRKVLFYDEFDQPVMIGGELLTLDMYRRLQLASNEGEESIL